MLDMSISAAPILARFILSAALLTALLLAGCASEAGPPKPPRPAPALIGREVFFGGKVVAELRIGPRPHLPRPPGAEGDEPAGRPRRGPGGFHPEGGPGMMGGGPGPGGGPGFGGGPGRPPSGPPGARTAPPLEIHLRFTNESDVAIELIVADFRSPLGNFAVQPERFTLAPHQTFAVEPMTSLLGTQVRDGDMVLTLRVGTERETKKIILIRETPPETKG